MDNSTYGYPPITNFMENELNAPNASQNNQTTTRTIGSNRSQTTARTVESNRSQPTTTEERMFGAYRNTRQDVLQPVSTEDAPLLYPLDDNTNNSQYAYPGTVARRPLENSDEVYNVPNYRLDSNQNSYLPNNNPYLRNYRSPNDMGQYPQTMYNNEERDDRDMEYFKQLYPTACRTLQRIIEEECNQYGNDSCIYDEYPDRVCLEHFVDRVYNRIKDMDDFADYRNQNNASNTDNVTANSLYYNPCPRCNWLYDMTGIMFYNELHNRRRRYFNRRRWF